MSNVDKQWWNQLNELMDKYCAIVENGLFERWEKFDVKISDSETYEVIGGLLARQATLTIHLAQTPQDWNGHIAPLILRCMVDAYINLAWILGDPRNRAKQYILYGLGQEKLFIEYLKNSQKNERDKDPLVAKLIDVREKWLNSQRHDFLTEVNVGSWSGLSTRKMAKEAGCEELYKFAYVPFSGVAHNMWQHISVYNLQICKNPLHKYHKVPSIPRIPLNPDFVYRSAKYIDRSYELFDKTFNITIDTPLPLNWFVEEFNRFIEKQNSKCKKN